jgi:hypothetical protein
VDNGGLGDVNVRQRTFALSREDVEREVSLYAEFVIERIGAIGVNGIDVHRRRRGGADFRYVYTGTDDVIRQYLKRLEIGVDNKASWVLELGTVPGH